MKKQETPKKLVLNKERIAQLTEREMESVIGGDGSTLHDFTCSWCTSGYGQPNPYFYGSGGTIYGQYTFPGGGTVGGSYTPGSGTYTISVTIPIG